MKKALFFFLLLPLASSAQYLQKGDLLASADLSFHRQKSDHLFEYRVHPQIQWMFSRHFSAGISAQYSRSSYTAYDSYFHNYTYGAGAEFRYWPLSGSRRFNPYVYANFNRYQYLVDGTYGDVLIQSNAGFFGIGALYAVTPNLFIEGRLNVLSYSFSKSRVSAVPAMSMEYGVTWKFGNTGKKKAAGQE